MAEEERLKLGKSVTFVKSRLKHLPDCDDAFPEARKDVPQRTDCGC